MWPFTKRRKNAQTPESAGADTGRSQQLRKFESYLTSCGVHPSVVAAFTQDLLKAEVLTQGAGADHREDSLLVVFNAWAVARGIDQFTVYTDQGRIFSVHRK